MLVAGPLVLWSIFYYPGFRQAPVQQAVTSEQKWGKAKNGARAALCSGFIQTTPSHAYPRMLILTKPTIHQQSVHSYIPGRIHKPYSLGVQTVLISFQKSTSESQGNASMDAHWKWKREMLMEIQGMCVIPVKI